MGKRTKLIEEIEAKKAELAEIEKAERGRINEVHKVITDLSNETGLFVGVVLSPEELAGIVKTAIESHDAIKIPFNVYSLDNE